jgi:hypothetical protein
VQVGDIVRHFLTEQIGIVLTRYGGTSALHVMWTTQGESLFGPGTKSGVMKEV